MSLTIEMYHRLVRTSKIFRDFIHSTYSLSTETTAIFIFRSVFLRDLFLRHLFFDVLLSTKISSRIFLSTFSYPFLQTPLIQSGPLLHLNPSTHFFVGRQLPPQSTSVSLPSRMPSLHVETAIEMVEFFLNEVSSDRIVASSDRKRIQFVLSLK